MKTRNGFVSNSSSSSFVIIGIILDKEECEKMGGYEFFEKMFEYVDFPEGENIVILGSRLGRWSDGDCSIEARTMELVMETSEKVTKTVQSLFPQNAPKVELIFGETYG